ncbi:hypothetical protein M0811_12634 [Anaeramoeba ignava]|uniref:Uncharacterized protein n=1 Tax=Anaeramoeba ignava TaxID=1746090 RepID=A0A9Q0LAK3_ANAIG|nr:hypothetical protein M0811_12634 [Anaeramoeba ignava]
MISNFKLWKYSIFIERRLKNNMIENLFEFKFKKTNLLFVYESWNSQYKEVIWNRIKLEFEIGKKEERIQN